MLIQLLPDQISRHWSEICKTVEASLPPHANKKRMSEALLKSLLSGVAQCWVITNGEKVIKGIGVTLLNVDVCSYTRALIAYSMFAYEPMSGREWEEYFRHLREYAFGRGCEYVIAITSSSDVIRTVERLGGSTEFREVVMEARNGR